MLEIGGVQINNIDDDILVNKFGYSYQRGDRIGDILAGFLENECYTYRFNDIQEMINAIMDRQDRYRPLVRWFVHAGPYTVVMSGRRSEDAVNANRAAGFTTTPDGCTWHHAENIRYEFDCYLCDMYLIETWYHKTPHRGGVNEYEIITGSRYY